MKIRKRNIKGLLILAGLFLVFLCRSADAAAQESRGMITDFES